jgi:hypothetical protein
VYQGALTSHGITLGAPAIIVQTPPLPAGKYLVIASAAANIAAGDNVVCATVPNSRGYTTNDGTFGVAGNSGSSSVYGSATITDTWKVTTAGDVIDLVCNDTNPGNGTATSASITALALTGVTKVTS